MSRVRCKQLFIAAAMLGSVSFTVLADTSISEHFAGIQRVIAPNGSIEMQSRVFAGQGWLRFEPLTRGEPGPLEILLVERATGTAYLLDEGRREVLHLDLQYHYMWPHFLMAVPLLEGFEGRPVPRRRIREEQKLNQWCDVVEVTPAPKFVAHVFVNQETRVPVQVIFDVGARAEWSDVVAGLQNPALFGWPSTYAVKRQSKEGP